MNKILIIKQEGIEIKERLEQLYEKPLPYKNKLYKLEYCSEDEYYIICNIVPAVKSGKAWELSEHISMLLGIV